MSLLEDLDELAPIKRRWSVDFINLPRDFVRAVAMAGLSPEQSMALMISIELGLSASGERDWKRREPAPFRPDFPTLARELGTTAQALANGFRGLESYGIIARPLGADGDRDFVLWTDWTGWTRRNGSPRFTKAQAAVILGTLRPRKAKRE